MLYSRGMPRWLQHTHILAVFAAASCNAQDVAEREPAGPLPKTGNERPVQALQVDTALLPLVEAAKKDLAERLSGDNITVDDIDVLQAQRVTWRSGAIGCPMPDRGYTMALVPGVLIRLRAGGEIYQYHGTSRGPAFLCEPPGRIETPAPANDAYDPT